MNLAVSCIFLIKLFLLHDQKVMIKKAQFLLEGESLIILNIIQVSKLYYTEVY